jgi:hypothetical protein
MYLVVIYAFGGGYLQCYLAYPVQFFDISCIPEQTLKLLKHCLYNGMEYANRKKRKLRKTSIN